MMMKLTANTIFFFSFGVCVLIGDLKAQTLPVNSWNYIQLDNHKGKWGDHAKPDWLRYFGLDMGDVDGDRALDILSGPYVYHNPGGNMSGSWLRSELPGNMDGILLLNVDNDEYADVIAQALPDVYWFEATDKAGTNWQSRKIGNVPATSHVNSQGFGRAQIIQGGQEEFVIAGNGNVYLFEIPANPETSLWKTTLIAQNTSDEGVGLGDIDGDGDLDLACGRPAPHQEEPTLVVWFENPGKSAANWRAVELGTSHHPIDRVAVGDVDGDKKADIIITEERWPGLEPEANLFWFQQPADPKQAKWTRHTIVTQYSMNNLDLKDLDRDGDLDIVTNEHKGPRLETQLWVNNGLGQFSKTLIDVAKENHLGTRLADLDRDGDLDLVGAAWDNYQLMHLWRNDDIDQRFSWKHLSTTRKELPLTNGGKEQTASLVVDVTNDGTQDIFITDRSVAPAVVGLFYTPNGWQRHVIEAGKLRIEAGSAAYDIDDDGDRDIVFGGEGQSNEIWWWENPYPNFDPQKPWTRHYVKKSGANKHHDMMFIDLDGDQRRELVFWNQGAQTLFYAKIPDNPKQASEWNYLPVYQYNSDGEMKTRSKYPTWRQINEHEGLAAADINGDLLMDIVGGGRWFEFKNGRFIEHIIDAGYTFTRSAAGQLIEGGRPEVLMVVGDGQGPLVLYEWRSGVWESTVLIEKVQDGHTLDVIDFNGDGHLDVFNAEMRLGNKNESAEVRVLLGDGKGHFIKHVVARGFGVHEGRMVDLDGDGDLDVLGKPYDWTAPRLDIWLNESKK